MLHDLTAPRHTPRQHEHEAAQRFNLFLVHIVMGGQGNADLFLEFVQRRLGQRQIAAGFFAGEHHVVVHVVFVLDLADDLFDQVLDGDQTVHAAVFVDDKGHMAPLGLHLCQQYTDGHRRGHEQQRAQKRAQVEILATAVKAIVQRDILEVGKADGRVQRALKHRQTGQPAFLELVDQFFERDGVWNGRDVGCRHGHILDPHAAQVDHAVSLRARVGRGLFLDRRL